jgi:thymidylate synthase
MREIFIEAKNLTDGYHQALLALQKSGDIVGCPDYNQLQKECSMTVCVEDPIREPRVSKLIIGGHYELQQYVLEILDGILDFKIGDGNCWEYTYHDRYAHQIPFILQELKRNPLTRRAIMNIRDFKVDSSNADPACMQSIQFFIRGDKLHMKVLFRSNDLPEAFFFNAFALIKLQEKVAAELGIPVGSYTHRANSMHCYEKNFGMLENFVKSIETKPAEELTYEYEGFYRDLMEESIPGIMKQVQLLKDNMGK